MAATDTSSGGSAGSAGKSPDPVVLLADVEHTGFVVDHAAFRLRLGSPAPSLGDGIVLPKFELHEEPVLAVQDHPWLVVLVEIQADAVGLVDDGFATTDDAHSAGRVIEFQHDHLVRIPDAGDGNGQIRFPPDTSAQIHVVEVACGEILDLLPPPSRRPRVRNACRCRSRGSVRALGDGSRWPGRQPRRPGSARVPSRHVAAPGDSPHRNPRSRRGQTAEQRNTLPQEPSTRAASTR